MTKPCCSCVGSLRVVVTVIADGLNKSKRRQKGGALGDNYWFLVKQAVTSHRDSIKKRLETV